MPTGVSSLYYPEQPKPAYDLKLDDSYVMLRLHDAQAYFEAGGLVKPGFLVFSSSTESTFQPGAATQSLHQISALQKNVVCRLGIATNLTDWLPARSTDSLKVNLKYTVVQDKPFAELVDQMGRIGLVAKVSLVRADWAVAVKVSELVGRLLSYLLREGSQHEIFSLMMDLNLVNRKAGYYAVLGSLTDENLPSTLRMDTGQLTDKHGGPLLRHSYAVVEVVALPRRGPEIARDEPWWELLQAGKEQAIDVNPVDEQERRKALADWKATLTQVRALARKDRGYLLNEIQQLIQTAQLEVETRLIPKTAVEAYGLDELPKDWQALLGVRAENELQQSIRDYQDALEVSRRLLEQYRLLEG
jgi:hypothetical protein